ncbi:MAG: DDE-type integrase/transposase/recombinase, partial [Nanoarchaeota archaeon]|nr:DDE-type integrase/transposase/recombinase [Nanoarchaeota archaeon]
MKETNQKTKCPYCQSEEVVKRGLSPTQNRGKQQRYRCNTCRKTFIQNLGFWKMKNSEAKITSAIDLYFSNLSSRKVRNHFRRHLAHNSSHVTVLDWCRKYVLKIQKYVDTLHPELSGKIYADETDIPRGCNTKRKGGDKFWCSVDWDTRYINATLYSPNPQNMKDAKAFMNKIKESKNIPKYIQTDALKMYQGAMRHVLGCNKTKSKFSDGTLRTKHIINNVQQTGKHNVRIETVFMKIKDRVDDFRGLKALWSAPILMAGIVLQHNYIEAHTTKGVVPCELAGLKLET